MKYSFIGALLGVGTGLLLGIAMEFESFLTILATPIIAGALSGLDRFLHRIFGLILYYILWFIGLLLHSILFASLALFAFAGIIMFSPYIIPAYFVTGYITSKLIARGKSAT